MESIGKFCVLALLWVLIPYVIQLVTAILLRLDLRLSLGLAKVFTPNGEPRTTLIGGMRKIGAVPFYILRWVEHLLYLLRTRLKKWISDFEENGEERDEKRRIRFNKEAKDSHYRNTFSYRERYKTYTKDFIDLPENGGDVFRAAIMGPLTTVADSLVFVINTFVSALCAAVVVFVGKYAMPNVVSKMHLVFEEIGNDYAVLKSVESLIGHASSILETAKSSFPSFSVGAVLPLAVFAVVAFIASPICMHSHLPDINLKLVSFYLRSFGRALASFIALWFAFQGLESIIPLAWSDEVFATFVDSCIKLGMYFDAALLFEFFVFVVVGVIYEAIIRPIGYFLNLKKKA